MNHQTAAASISSSMTMIRSAVVQKRERDENDSPSHSVSVQAAAPTPAPSPVYEVPLQMDPSPTSKKSRSNRYSAPKVVKPSILTAMGSLVGGGGLRDVPMRRQLSSGAIDSFLGRHDNMQTDEPSDHNDSMPRRMSF
ncbi:unnamed protein product [Cylindrotheca closterium]|uniref:Uncharacterized protein n=1 Tax=Cylindrotheca closterium TaxID=2856 RepID=A0AAD2G350_9STRA|nr:unnamed protein product [Cylindrotheca closterium]